MDLLDTIEGIDPLDGSLEEYPPHGALLREDRKLRTSTSGEERIRRLSRIQKIVRADPNMVVPAMECMLSFQAEEREVALQVREVILDCLIPMIEWPSSMDPELCTRAMEVLARMDFLNDRAFLYEMDKILLEKFPYSYTVHRHILERYLSGDEIFRPAEVNLVQEGTHRSLKETEQRTGTTLLNGTTINVDACKLHTDLPPELLRFAALQEINGNFLEALAVFQAMITTMRNRPRFNEYAPFLVHYRNLLYRCSLIPQIINDDAQLHACQARITQVDEELSFITGGWNPAFSGTAKIQKMQETVGGNEYVGAPHWEQKEVGELVAAFNTRTKEELPN